jgi:hypothetical protein
VQSLAEAELLVGGEIPVEKPRWRRTLRPALPRVNCGVGTKSAMLKSWPRLRAIPEYGSPMRLGRLTMSKVPVLAGLPELTAL